MIKNKILNRIIFAVVLAFVNLSCVEEIQIDPQENYTSLLVIEATITDQLINQKILLSRSFELDSLGPKPETNASVQVADQNGNILIFEEAVPGEYISVDPFSALANVDYKLEVTTSDGRIYESKESKLSNSTDIQSLYVERNFNENNEEGVSIFLDANDATGQTNYYKYEYEETYKIVAPLYSPLELTINNDDYPYPPDILAGLEDDEIVEFFVKRQFRETQEQICYNTVKSNRILLASTSDLVDNNLSRFRLRFLSRENYIIQHRYSINVRQYLQSLEAHLFYTTMLEINEGGSIFSEVQTGFVSGNVFSRTNETEPVVGYFEVAAVNEERIYFNFSDLFPNEELPPYYKPCDDFISPDLFIADPLTGVITDSPIQNDIEKGNQYWSENSGGDPGNITVGNPYQMVLPYCGDCTELGVNETPIWWED